MSADIAHELNREQTRDDAAARSVALQARIVLALGPATTAGGVALGARPAVAADAAAPVRAGLLVAPRRAAALRRARRAPLPVADRAGDRRRPRGGARTRDRVLDRSRPPRWCTGGSRPGSSSLGLLLLSEAVVGAEVWGRRPWRRYLWPGVLLRDGRPDVPGDDVLHVLDDPHARPRLVGAGDDARRRGRARASRAASSTRATGGCARRSALAVSGLAVLVHEQNHWLFSRTAFLHHVLGWTALVAALFPIAADVPAAVALGRVRLRDDVRPDRGAPLLRPRHAPRSSGTSTSTRACRTGEAPRPPRRRARRARRAGRRAPRTRRSCRRRPALRAGAAAGAGAGRAHATTSRSTPSREAVVVLNAKGVNVAGPPRAEKPTRRS